MHSIIFDSDHHEKKLKDSDFFIEDLSKELEDDPLWISDLENLQKNRIALHLAILHEPYLELILEGKKTIETRFSIHRQAPFEQITKNDVILLKETSGPVVGFCRVSDAWFYVLNQNSWDIIKNEFFKEILVKDQRFWEDKKNSSYASLIRIRDVHRLKYPLDFPKRDRRGWVVLIPRDYNTKLNI
jgi:ASC-1-like (ASCH) protein